MTLVVALILYGSAICLPVLMTERGSAGREARGRDTISSFGSTFTCPVGISAGLLGLHNEVGVFDAVSLSANGQILRKAASVFSFEQSSDNFWEEG